VERAGSSASEKFDGEEENMRNANFGYSFNWHYRQTPDGGDLPFSYSECRPPSAGAQAASSTNDPNQIGLLKEAV
jgi:hypothetical protein